MNYFKINKKVSKINILFYLCSRFTAKGAIAQMVEQRTENPCVLGSIPSGTTKKSPANSGWVFLLLLSSIPLEHLSRTLTIDNLKYPLPQAPHLKPTTP